MIGVDEVSRHAAHFGVPQSQIIRDHLISHALLAIGTDPHIAESVTFFGDTALCRTWLPGLRLSEDIDLLVDSKDAGAMITKRVSRHLRCQFPEHQWTHLESAHDVDTWSLTSGFAAMKLMAWFERQAPRDLFDLATQAEAGHIDVAAIQLVRRIAGHRPTPTSLGRRVSKVVESAWSQELEHQLTTTRSAADCFALLRTALGELDDDWSK